MDKSADKGRVHPQGGGGLDKTYTITKPSTGETREVTQRQWRDEKLGKAGWEKPADLEEAEGDEAGDGSTGD